MIIVVKNLLETSQVAQISFNTLRMNEQNTDIGICTVFLMTGKSLKRVIEKKYFWKSYKTNAG